ncbi:MAG TPA: M48 family metalloprotease [Casimicrobiaceae bacterium]|nr:M48 family metalloprotease [Casimicrobiaceae bacterium]
MSPLRSLSRTCPSGRRAIAFALVCALEFAAVAPAPLAAEVPLAADVARTADPLPEYGVAPPVTKPLPEPSSPNSLPDLGDAAQSALSPAQERKLGETIMQQARANGGVMNDPEVNDYLQQLGHRITSASKDIKQDFEFFAVNDPSINAFALPGGFIGVHTGLILLTQSESELAAVLAHEISHVTQHHIARMVTAQKDAMLMTLAGLALAILAARSGSGSGADVASGAVAASQAMMIQNQLNFTRANEYEADRIGFQRLDAAGFDVGAMATFMKRMQRAVRLSEGNAPNYLRTHPLTYERIAEAEARAQNHPYRQVVDSLDFHMVRALLKSYEGDPKDAVAYFDDAIAEHKYNNEVAVHYGLVASLLRAGSLDRAKVELAKLQRIAPEHPMIETIAAHVMMDSGDLAGAIKRFESALTRYPNKMQLVYDYPDALIRAGRFSDAAQFAERQLLRFPTDGPLHLYAARAYAGLHKDMAEHRHQGEYYAWQGDIKGAIVQFELASKAKDGDFYQASEVDARLRALRREASDQQKSGFARNG